MIGKCTGIVLRVEAFSRTSHVVSWLTEADGRLTTLAKGAQRRRSAFLGQYDLFYACELLYYQRASRSLHILKECAPLKTRNRFRDDWASAAAASYLCDLVWRLCPAGPGHENVYRLLDRTLDLADAQGAVVPLVFWFEVRLAGCLGFAPNLDACPACKRRLRPSPHRAALFSLPRGGLLCQRCAAGTGARQGGMPVSPDVLAVLRAWQGAEQPTGARRSVCTVAQRQAIENLLGAFLSYHLDRVPPSRAIALRLLDQAGRTAAPPPAPQDG
jgi:DNA repair protein RecO (recombination protein O)